MDAARAAAKAAYDVPIIESGVRLVTEVPIIESGVEVPIIEAGVCLVTEVPMIESGVEVPIIEAGVGLATEVPMIESGDTLSANRRPPTVGCTPVASITSPTSTFVNLGSDIAGVKSIFNSPTLALPTDVTTEPTLPLTKILVAPGT